MKIRDEDLFRCTPNPDTHSPARRRDRPPLGHRRGGSRVISRDFSKKEESGKIHLRQNVETI